MLFASRLLPRAPQGGRFLFARGGKQVRHFRTLPPLVENRDQFCSSRPITDLMGNQSEQIHIFHNHTVEDVGHTGGESAAATEAGTTTTPTTRRAAGDYVRELPGELLTSRVRKSPFFEATVSMPSQPQFTVYNRS